MSSRFAAIAVLGIVGCLSGPKFSGFEGNFATRGLEADLRTAAAALVEQASGTPYQLRWVGTTYEDYGIERGPTGVPIRKVALVSVVIEKTDTHECFGEQDRNLARQNEGGDTYGKPF